MTKSGDEEEIDSQDVVSKVWMTKFVTTTQDCKIGLVDEGRLRVEVVWDGSPLLLLPLAAGMRTGHWRQVI